MARVLITGASGFIGGYLVEKALDGGNSVWATVRVGSDTSRLRDPRIHLVQLPFQDQVGMTQILRALGRFDWIIHNAGVTKALDQKGYYEGNTGNTQRLVQAIFDSATIPEKFLFVSSLAALGAAPNQAATIQEGQAPAPLTSYGGSKLEAERWLESLNAAFPWVAIQPTAVYGPWERDILTFIRLVNKGLELTVGTHSQKLSFVHAQDVAGAVFRILDHPQGIHRKFIVSDGHAYQTEDLGDAIRNALGKSRTLKIKLPLSLVRPIAHFTEWTGRIQGKARPLNREKIAELAASNWHCDPSPLLQEIGFSPTFDLKKGMLQTIEWYKQHGWL